MSIPNKNKRTGLSNLPKKNSPVILLYSGGLDSTALWYLLLKKYQYQVYPIFFYVSNRHKRKIKKTINFFYDLFFKKFGALSQPPYFHKIDFIFGFHQNLNLVKKDIDLIIPNIKNLNKCYQSFPNVNPFKHKKTIVLNDIPARMLIFSSLAFQYSLKLRYTTGLNIKNIFIGLTPEDRFSNEATASFINSLNITLCKEINNFSWQIWAPIFKKNFYYEKLSLVKSSLKDSIPLDKTISCTKSPFYSHCGQCFNCLTRKYVFTKLKYKDKTFYYSDFRDKVRNFLRSFKLVSLRKRS